MFSQRFSRPSAAGPQGARRRRAGFTIFEVTMATMVMAFGIATSITAMNAGFRALDTARNTTIAGQILESTMEDLRLLPWNSVTALAGNATVTIDSSFTNNDPTAQAVVNRFTITRSVVGYYPSTTVDSNTLMVEIDLTAKWTGIDNRSHSVTYTSYYGKYGLHDYFVN